MKLRGALLLVLSLSPALAFARPAPATPHVQHAQTVHDRTPKAHVHSSRAHQR